METDEDHKRLARKHPSRGGKHNRSKVKTAVCEEKELQDLWVSVGMIFVREPCGSSYLVQYGVFRLSVDKILNFIIGTRVLHI